MDGKTDPGPATGDPAAEAERLRREGKAPRRPGTAEQDPSKTPGDGTLQGATPAGLTVDELLERARAPGQPNDTGTG
jgi:hypothetical protein